MADDGPDEVFDTLRLSEDATVEFKRASGKDGTGHLPDSVFETYSAMANSYGGSIVLGIEEPQPNKFRVSGIVDVGRVIKQLWDALNNKQKVSVNLLHDKDVQVIPIAGKQVILINVPRASRVQRPVFIDGNPMTGTYTRNHEGDYVCHDDETVKRMLAEQVEPERDGKLLNGYSIGDLDLETFRSYRQLFAGTKRNHPWTSLEDLEFLRSIVGWAEDRINGEKGLTLAGLLMFGKLPSIQDCVPNYMLDYQEMSELKTSQRWSDRLITDGSWSGNLFDFYRKVINKLCQDLKVPFQLSGGKRTDDTPIHEALREALVNTLIHADFSERLSILVTKRPDVFTFRNPGLMRVSIEDAMRGGCSDCRNRRLQKMFLLVGFAEQAGSGIPKIWTNWQGQHWRVPDLVESSNPDQTVLSLRMLDLFPESAITELTSRFGNGWKELSEIQRIALATVASEDTITHARLKSMTSDHSSDISKALHNLVKEGYLQSSGAARGTSYSFGEEGTKEGQLRLFSTEIPSAQGSEQMTGSSEQMTGSSEQMTGSSEQMTGRSEQMTGRSEQMTAELRTNESSLRNWNQSQRKNKGT